MALRSRHLSALGAEAAPREEGTQTRVGGLGLTADLPRSGAWEASSFKCLALILQRRRRMTG